MLLSDERIVLVILNQPVEVFQAFLRDLWPHSLHQTHTVLTVYQLIVCSAAMVICGDGGANRLYAALGPDRHTFVLRT